MKIAKTQKKQGRYFIEEAKEEIFFYKFFPEKEIVNLMVMGDKNHYFKANGKHTLDVSELFACALAKAVNYHIVEQHPAVFVNKNGIVYEGVIAKDYVTNREKVEIMSAANALQFYFKDSTRVYENAIENHYAAAKYYVDYFNEDKDSKNKLKLDPNFVKDLQKLHLFNFLICGEDAWGTNMEYMIENNTLKLGTPFDFSYSFLLKSFTTSLRENYANFTSLNDRKALVQKRVENANMPFQVFKENANNKNREVVAREIARILLQDDELNEFYHALKKVNLKQVLQDYKQSNDYRFIKKTDIEMADLVFQASYKQIEVALEHEARFQNSPMEKVTKTAKKYYEKEFLNYHKQPVITSLEENER